MGAFLKIKDQGYRKLFRGLLETLKKELDKKVYSQAHEIRNWQCYDEIRHEHSLNHCTLL